MIKGENIRKKRKALGLTGQELADILGVSKANLYKWEKGHSPANPKDYIAVENWLSNGEVESVPNGTKEEKESKSPVYVLGSGSSYTLDDLIDDLRNDKAHLQETIRVNLTALMQLLTALSQHDRAYHDVILKSLARLEKKKEGALVEEARTVEAVKVVEVLNKGKNADTRM